MAPSKCGLVILPNHTNNTTQPSQSNLAGVDQRATRRAAAQTGAAKKRRSPRGLRHSCSSYYLRTKVARAATASERPSVGPGRARGDEPARIPLWHPGQYKALTNDEPRHQPARPETRPNQRLYVPLGSPPSVAVGSSSARAAHLSRAPQIDVARMTSIATRVKIPSATPCALCRGVRQRGVILRVGNRRFGGGAGGADNPSAKLPRRWVGGPMHEDQAND